MAALSRFLELSGSEAERQWLRIARRSPKPRQERYLPVEVLLCYGLFFIVNPHRYGGANRDAAPRAVHALARAFQRTPGSILSKMLNLDGSRRNSGRLEPELFLRLSNQPDAFAALYTTVLTAARNAGFDSELVPDFMGLLEGHEFSWVGQEQLAEGDIEYALRQKREEIVSMSDSFDLEEVETTRLVIHKARIGQHRFAQQVMENYEHTCAFCGFCPTGELRRKKLIHASHIKPWRECNDRERLDVRNGVAACAIHDAAFDSGLLTINGGFRIHKASGLVAQLQEPQTARLFGEEVIAQSLLFPEGKLPPGREYLRFHRAHIFQDPPLGSHDA